MRCRRSNGRGSVVKNDESRIPISDNGTNPHFYIEPASIWDINVHSSMRFSFEDHLSLHYDENIGNWIFFSLELTQTYILYDGILRIWPKRSVIGLTQPGMEFRILCLEGSVISPSFRRFSPPSFAYMYKGDLNLQSFIHTLWHRPYKMWCGHPSLALYV